MFPKEVGGVEGMGSTGKVVSMPEGLKLLNLQGWKDG